MARKVRLAVGSPDALHSSVWTIWTQGDELYAATRTGGLMKVSVHSSGVCLNAYTTESGVRSQGESRVIDRWNIAAVGEVPWTACLKFMVPSVYIPERCTEATLTPTRRASVRRLAPAQLGRARTLLLLRAQTADQHISEHLGGDYEVVETLSLRSGGVVWLLTYEEQLKTSDYQHWQRLASEMKIHGMERDNLWFANLTVGLANEPRPTIIDVALGPSNVRPDGEA